ncbi:MAG: hypothetical protein ACRD9R_19240 [Pyrinomonadaceae bacterium]
MSDEVCEARRARTKMLSLILIAELAVAAHFITEALVSLGYVRGYAILVGIFLCPLLAALPVRGAGVLRGAATNGLFLLISFSAYASGSSWAVIGKEFTGFLTVFGFSIASGMAAGGLVERRRESRHRLGGGQPQCVRPPRVFPQVFYLSEPVPASYLAVECESGSDASATNRNGDCCQRPGIEKRHDFSSAG